MKAFIEVGTFSQGVDAWKQATQGMTILAYYPSFKTETEPEIIEPGDAINLSLVERARMNQAKPGVYTRPGRV
jgi:hypothetical protein